MCKGNRFLIWILILLSFSGCEYQLDKVNFRDLKKPSDLHQFDLNLVAQDDTIRIFTRTEFTCNFNTYGLEVRKGEFSLQGTSWGVYSEKAKFTVSPENFYPGYDTLTLVLITSSGSGSLADILEAEGYKVVRKWLVLVDGRPAPIITATKSITPEGFLRISWPKCEQYNFQYYSFRGWPEMGTGSISKTITDPGQNYYIDSCFAGGKSDYRVDSKVYGDNMFSYGNQLYLDEPYPLLSFIELGVDSLRVAWNKSPYSVTYKLMRNDLGQDSIIFQSHTDTSYTMANPGFGQRAQFKLSTSSRYESPNSKNYTLYDYKNYVLGKGIAGNWPDYAYNRFDKVLYTSTYDDMECFDIETLSLQKSKYLKNLIYQSVYSCPTNSAKVAAITADSIYVFADKSLQNPAKIPYDCWGYSIEHFYLTDNDLIAIEKPNKYELIRISDKQLMATINLSDYPTSGRSACISTSRKGEYACMATPNGINLFKIENGSVSTLYTDTRVYRSALFNVNTDGQLLLTFYENNTLEVRNASDFSLVRTITLPTNAEVLRNIDPESGYLLLTDFEYMYVLDLSNSKILFKVRSTDFKPKLYGNKLFSGNGYYLDIYKYLHK